MSALGGKRTCAPLRRVGGQRSLGAAMRLLFLLLALLAWPADARPDRTESDIRRTVQTFYDAFNSHDFRQLDRVTTPEWNHINPLGGRTIGRAAVLAELRQVHSTFLKGV